MALDVHLNRGTEELWGFEILGGTDEAPLRVDKVQPNSPADKGGLQNGDTILSINGAEAIDMSQADARRVVTECGDSLKLGVMRGLYDPVLDDQEPIIEPFEPADSDQQLEPTEVPFKIQQFTDQPDPLNILEPLLKPRLTESRSLTASPFVLPAKPYRPFSTEPVLDVPPLEEPIILNPNYKDQFGSTTEQLNPDQLLVSYYKDTLNNIDNETKFKLPISAQYDPDGKKKVDVSIESTFKYIKFNETTVKDLKTREDVRDVTNKNVKSIYNDKTNQSIFNEHRKEEKFDVTQNMYKEIEVNEAGEYTKKDLEHSEKKIINDSYYEEIDDVKVKEELNYIEKMKQEIDLNEIEETALSIVDENIERAVSVTEEINKEINEEFSDNTEVKSGKYEKKETYESIKTVEESEEFKQQTEVPHENQPINEYKTQNNKYEEKKDAAEVISDSPKRNITKETETKTSNNYEESFIKEERNISAQERETGRVMDSEYDQEYIESAYEGKESKSEFKKVTKTDSSAEQRIYAIGLQTIPNIRGTVHSSYHYDLLLKTFFIHLTDVMVALSRFLLTQPVFNTEKVETRETVTKNQMHERADNQVKKVGQTTSHQKFVERRVAERPTLIKDKKESKIEDFKVQSKTEEREIEHMEPVRKEKIAEMEIIKTENKQEMMVKKDTIQEKNETKNSDRKISGSSLAQLSEKKMSQDVTKKMDAVVSEFQSKVSVDSVDMLEVKKQIVERNRRSRSRSQVEEEVMRESDPLEWLAKVDSRRASQERTEVKTEFMSSEKHEKKIFESNYEKKQPRKTKSPKQMYVAIVEAHVYTNKDAILEEQLSELSETSSVQSAEEMNTAFETIQMESSENVAIENAVKELEIAKTVVQDSFLDTATSNSQATVEIFKQEVQDTKEILDYKTEEKAVVKNEIQEVLIQESAEIIEPVIDIQETNYEKASIDINQSLMTAESREINISESKKELLNTEEIKKETVSVAKEDYKSRALKTELIADEFVETVQAHEVDSKYEVVKPEYKIVEGEEVTEKVVIKPVKVHKYKVEEASAELKIIKEVEIESQAEIIEIEDENELITESGVNAQSVINKLQLLKSLEVDESANVTEKSIITSELNSNLNTELDMVKMEGDEKESNSVSKSSQSEVSQLNQSQVLKKQSITSESATQLEITKSDQSQLMQKQATSEIELKSVTQSEHTLVNKQANTSSEYESKTIVNQSETNHQESSFAAKSASKKLEVQTDLALNRQVSVQSDENNNIDSPTPSTVPATPLVDEYVFKLTIPLPKSRCSTPVPRDCTPEDEDPHIVKKKLVPHIETTIERVVYDPPLPTPPESKVQSPVYTKPGLRGGSDRPQYRRNKQEELRDIERRSSLLASAIDETIKSIEEYKEEVGIDTKQEVKVQEFKSEKFTKSFESSYSKEVTMQNGVIDTNSEIKNNVDNTDKSTNILENTAKDNLNSVDEVIELSESSGKTENNTEINSEKSDSKTENHIDEIVMKATENIETSLENKDTAELSDELESKIEFQTIELSRAKTETVNKNTVEEMQTSPDTKVVHDSVTDIETVVNTKTSMSDTSTNVSIAENEKSRKNNVEQEKVDPLSVFRPVVFDPEAIPKRETPFIEVPQIDEILHLEAKPQDGRLSPYLTPSGESIGTIQGIVDGLEEAVVDAEVAKELGKPGIPEEKIAELISGEAEMLREAHVMGLSRVLNSHMHRVDDSSVDFQKIKPMIGSLKDSEVLKALNEDLAKAKEEQKKKEEKKWTTFLQKPKRPVPKANFGYHGWTSPEPEIFEEPYKVKIVKQPKPKVAPDYKPEDFDTGPLPWEERPIEVPLPIAPEDPILVPEEQPEILEAVDPLPESEIPDLEDTGIPLPPVIPTDPIPVTQELPELPEEPPKDTLEEPTKVTEQEEVIEEPEKKTEGMENRVAEQLVRSVQSMVDPNATLEQQLAQMRAQLAALAQLPEVIQQTLELVTRQLSQIGQQEARVEHSASQTKEESYQHIEVQQNHFEQQETVESSNMQKEINSNGVNEDHQFMNGNQESGEDKMTIEEVVEDQKREGSMQDRESAEIMQQMKEQEMRTEKQKKEQTLAPKRPASRANKPQPKFGPLDPDQRPVVLPGGRRWRNTQDVYNEQLIAETLTAQAELIQGKALGINFMKYEKPPVSLDHLQHSEVYKLIHNMEEQPKKRVELLTPVICEADYRERCRSMTPSIDKINRLNIPQQFHP